MSGLTRTWTFRTEAKTHTIVLHHDRLSGLRSVEINQVEVPGSIGLTTQFIRKPHEIPFSLDDSVSITGFLSIAKSGFFGFKYRCDVGGEEIAEATQQVPNFQEDKFSCHISSTETTPDDAGNMVVWYVVVTTRLPSGEQTQVQTQVHRRFRDFSNLLEQVKESLRGHHLYSNLPSLPSKTLKYLLTSEKQTDAGFVAARMQSLDLFLKHLCSVPHVADMTCLQGFVGFVGGVREYSCIFQNTQLGITLLRGADDSVVVGSTPLTTGEATEGASMSEVLCVGDCVSKVNGIPLGDSGFAVVVARIRGLPRPLVVHFVNILA